MGVSSNANTYALKVRGDSMIDAHIMDGDMVVMEDKPASNRDIVAALIDGETTLKRLVIENRKKVSTGRECRLFGFDSGARVADSGSTGRIDQELWKKDVNF